MRTKVFSKIGISLLIFLGLSTTLVWDAFTQDALPHLVDVVSAVNQNRRKVSNVKLRVVRVTAQPTNFFDDMGFKDTNIDSVRGQRVYVNRSLVALSEQGRFVDEEEKTVGEKFVLQRHEKYWFSQKSGKTRNFKERQQILSGDGKVVELVPAVYDVTVPLPLGAVEDLQIHIEGLTRDLVFVNTAKVVGFENFRGLKCVRIEWGKRQKDENWGVYLICPQRDWKIVWRENFFGSGEAEGTKSIYQKVAVEEFRKYDDIWIPSVVRTEYKKIGFDGLDKMSINKLKLVEFSVDSVNEDLIFDPLLSPGTKVITKSGTEVVGGNVSAIIDQIRQGDFSILEETIKDMG